MKSTRAQAADIGEQFGTRTNMGAGPLVPGSVDGADCPVVLLIVLGLDEAATAAVIDQITDQEPLAGHVPVFFTDLDRFDLFRSKGHVFEHMPSMKSRSLAPEGLPWQHYTRRRLDLLQTKWRPAATIPFGPIASEALTGWRQVRDTTKFTGRFSNSHYTAGKMEAGT